MLRINRARHLLVEVGEDFWPGVFVADSGLLVWEACVREAEMRPAVMGLQLDRHDGLGAFCRCSKPCQFHKLIALKSEEPAIVRMPRSFELCFEEERRVDFPLHQDRSRRRKPAIELLRPRAEEDSRWRVHGALDRQAEGF